MIKKESGLYFVYSQNGKKLSNGYKTEKEAISRLKEIEALKDSLFDKAVPQIHKYIDKATGFLHIDAILARTGVQDYLGFELGDDIEPFSVVGVYRPAEEVLSKDSLATYVNAPVTDNHPSEMVTTDNAKDLIKGSVSSIETFNKDGIDYIKAKMTITDKKLIEKAINGKIEVSAGYSQMLVKEKGEYNGKLYDYKQTDIRINHIAIVDKGRCGGGCKLIANDNVIIDGVNQIQGKTMVITIDNKPYDVDDAIATHIAGLNGKITSIDGELSEALAEIATKIEVIEAKNGEVAKLKEDLEVENAKTSDENILALVNEKVALIDTAKKLNVTVDCNLSSMDIKKAVIAANSKISLDGKSDDFVGGVYDTIIASTIEKQKNVTDSQQKAFDNGDKKQTTSYDKYVEGLKTAYKGEK